MPLLAAACLLLAVQAKDDPDTVYVYGLKKADKSFVARFTVTKDKKVYSVAISPEGWGAGATDLWA